MPSCSCGIDLLEAGAGRSDAASELAGRLSAAPLQPPLISEVPQGPSPCVSCDEIGALVAILTVSQMSFKNIGENVGDGPKL